MVSENGLEMAMAAWFPRAAIAVVGALLIGTGSVTALELAKRRDGAFVTVFTLSTYTGPVLKAVLCLVSGPFLIWVAITVHASPRMKKQYLRWTLMAWAGFQGVAFLLDLGQCTANQRKYKCWGANSFSLCVGLSFLCIVLVKREKLFWIFLLIIGVGYLTVESSVKAYTDGDVWKNRLPNSFNETLPHSIAVPPLFFLLIILILRWRSSMRDADARIARAKDEYDTAWDVVTKQLPSKAQATSGGGNIKDADHQEQQTHAGQCFSTVAGNPVLAGQWAPEPHEAGGGGGGGALEVRVAAGCSPAPGAGSGERGQGADGSLSSAAAGQDPLSELATGCRKVVEELRHGQPKAAGGLGKAWAKLAGLLPAAQAGGRGRFSDKGKIRQATDDMEQLFLQATQVNAIFHDQIWRLCRLQVESEPSPVAREVEQKDQKEEKGKQEKKQEKQGRGAEAKEEPGPRAVLIRGPVKHPKRAIEKVVRCYSRDAACLTDIVRCTVVCKDVAQVLALLRHILSRATVGVDDLKGNEIAAQPERQAETLSNCRSGAGHDRAADKCGSDGVFRVVSLKNRFDPDNAEAKRTGYRDVCLNLEVGWLTERGSAKLVALGPSGSGWSKVGVQTHICEVQIHVDELFKVKQESGNHQSYIQWRNLLTR